MQTATRNAPVLVDPRSKQSTPTQGSVTPPEQMFTPTTSLRISESCGHPQYFTPFFRIQEIDGEAEPANVNAGARPSRRQASNLNQ
jgi:hypothetical protein